MKIKQFLVLIIIVIAILGIFNSCEEPGTGTSYTVTFQANGGSPAPAQQSIIQGGKVIEPAVMTKAGFNFGGWYKEAEFTNLWNFNVDTVSKNFTLYARWKSIEPVPGETLLQKLQWLSGNAESNTIYLLEINSNESIISHTLSYNGKNNITIRLIGIGGEKTIEISGNGSIFTIENGVNLILEENIVLKGKANNNASLVRVNSGGTFTMNGGEISGNTVSSSGGGVYVDGSDYGGDYGGIFTMNGGKISGNTASSFGGGVYVYRGTFTMNGGEISGNTASSSGGGVYYYDVDGTGGPFTMNDGKISGNTASSSGGGVYVGGRLFGGTFTMNGGEISGNTASSFGGGVYFCGVYVLSGYVYYSNFSKTGGIIKGYSSDSVNGNVVKYSGVIQNEQGHAVYVDNSINVSFIRRKETTAGEGDDLIYIRNESYYEPYPPNPPTISGAWDE